VRQKTAESRRKKKKSNVDQGRKREREEKRRKKEKKEKAKKKKKLCNFPEKSEILAPPLVRAVLVDPLDDVVDLAAALVLARALLVVLGHPVDRRVAAHGKARGVVVGGRVCGDLLFLLL
jgi:hypothetical protein